jgi:hypothetical protein
MGWMALLRQADDLRPVLLDQQISKRRDAPYRSGRSKAWVKVKNPTSPAIHRVREWAW